MTVEELKDKLNDIPNDLNVIFMSEAWQGEYWRNPGIYEIDNCCLFSF